MREVELKILLEPDQEMRLRAEPALAELGPEPRIQSLHSIYYDTEDGALRARGIALRLRKKGRSWVRTVKKAEEAIDAGLSCPIEDEIPVKAGDFALDLIADDDLREEIIGIARAGLIPVAETRLRRTIHDLTRDGIAVELAIDRGEIEAGGRTSPLIEAELELKAGAPSDLFDLATRLFPRGPIRFSNRSKSERAVRLGEGQEAVDPVSARRARPAHLDAAQSAESAAQAVLGECLSHAVETIPLAVMTHDPLGPHQIRVGLRRFRSALSAFRPALGREAVAPLADQARRIGTEVGRVRDLDVLLADLIAPIAERYPEEPGFAALAAAVEERRETVADQVASWLSGPEVTRFVFTSRGWLLGRGWLDPADHDQTARLAEPVESLARRQLDRRWKAVRKYGRRIRELTVEERHEMRKEIKKLRYVAEIFRSLYDPAQFGTFRAALKRLQSDFGALNDTAMAENYLMDPAGPGADDPAAQRAAGRIIGMTQAEADRLWPRTIKDWHALARIGRFWR